jgi:hypothetical protein
MINYANYMFVDHSLTIYCLASLFNFSSISNIFCSEILIKYMVPRVDRR